MNIIKRIRDFKGRLIRGWNLFNVKFAKGALEMALDQYGYDAIMNDVTSVGTRMITFDLHRIMSDEGRTLLNEATTVWDYYILLDRVVDELEN